MERKTYKIIPVLFFCLTITCTASYKSDIYTAYITNNMEIWKNVIDKMNGIPDKDHVLILELVNYQYGYIGWCMGGKAYDEAKKYLKMAEKNIALLSGRDDFHSLVNSYRAAFYGYRIGLNNMLAPFIGFKSMDAAKTAIASDPGNPMGFIQQGNILFYSPPVVGGSKNEAVKYYLKALKIMENDIIYLEENWNYLNLLVVIAQTYSYLNDIQSTRYYLEKIMTHEPDIQWVRNELYPQLMERIHNKL